MKKKNIERTKSRKSFFFLSLILALIACSCLIILLYRAHTSGSGPNDLLPAKTNGLNKDDTLPTGNSAGADGPKIDFLLPVPAGQQYTEPPQISNVAAADLDGDKLLDIVVCDTKANTVSWIRQFPEGVYTESVLAKGFTAPAHVQVRDIDRDGDPDLMVAVLGMLAPNNDKIGSVVLLENDGHCHFKAHIAAEKIARVSDVRAGDLDGDGDLDLAVAQFGYSDGETRWIENKGNWKFESHVLQQLSGPINVIITDIDKDNDLDIVSLVSQEWEELYCFINDGKGNFQPKRLWGSNNEDFGSSGIYVSDIDKDGDDDILYTNGDSFNYSEPADRPWHGIQWLENKGGINFVFHRICNLAGAYNCRPVDIDHDGDIDLFAVSGFNNWNKPASQSFIWLENDGHMRFTKHAIANAPTHLITLDTGDFNGDGLMDMVTGGMYLYPPYNKMGRVTLWMNNGLLPGKK